MGLFEEPIKDMQPSQPGEDLKVLIQEGTGEDIKNHAVVELSVGTMLIMEQPEDLSEIDDPDPSQHALYFKIEVMNGDKHEFMFHAGHASDIFNEARAMLQRNMEDGLKMLGAPDDIIEGYVESSKQANDFLNTHAAMTEVMEMLKSIKQAKKNKD